MNRVICAAVFAVLASACGGPLDEEQALPSEATTATSAGLHSEAPPPLQPTDAPDRPMEILGVYEPTIVFDFSDGRIAARLSVPPPEARALYDTRMGGHGGGCRH